MPLSIGDTLGPYKILAPIGAGGMGEVYRARDTRLGRDVAIKVLPQHLSSDPVLRERFEREARAISTLNHPRICTLHDVGHQSGIDFLVMEYLEGESLAERLRKGPLPLKEALKIGMEVCEALEEAHRAKIIHRDLKPANIMLTKSGAKLMDFGLATATATEREAGAASGLTLPTATTVSIPSPVSPLTSAGQVLGTIPYMSPEQIEGKKADARSDLFALGAVLYEMATGKRAFQGKSQISVASAILEKDPEPISSLQPLAPLAFEHVVRTCLEKDPDDRWQSARDIKSVLELIQAHAMQAVALPASPWRERAAWIAAAVLALTSALSLWSPWRAAPTSSQPMAQLDLDLGAPVSGSRVGTAAIVSPDGTRLVFVSNGADGRSRLSKRRLDQAKPTELPGTEDAYGPFFSPDGSSVGFFSSGKLRKTSLDGGDPVILCDAPAGRGATWNEDGNIVAALDVVRGLSLIPSAGGPATALTEIEPGESGHRSPYALPGGKAVLFTFSNVNGNYEEAGIAVVSLKDRHRTTILNHAGMNPMYLPSGHLAYVTKGALFAVPFDPDRLELHGEAKPIIQDVVEDSTYGSIQFSCSRTGSALYRAGRAESLRDVLWLTGDGRTEPLWPEPVMALDPRLSPDGRRLAVSITNGSALDLWVYDIDKTTRTRLTNGMAGRDAVWSPDGQYIVFQAPGGMFWTRADGAGQPEILLKSENYTRPGSFSPDGRRLAYAEPLAGGGGAIKTLPVEFASGRFWAGAPETFLKSTATANLNPRLSRDGHWLAYNDAESGTFEVHVRAFPGREAEWQISNDGGTFPVWSPDGHELFYRSSDNRIMVVNYIAHGTEFSTDKPRVWSERRLFDLGIAATFDLSPDGKRFSVLVQHGGDQLRTTQNHVTLLLHFLDEVRRRAPPGK